jgi:hypothetical protein
VNGAEITLERRSRRPLRLLAVLVLVFLVGIGCTRVFQFTLPLLNYMFVAALLCFPFTAIRPLSQLSRWPRLAGFILLVPLLLICVLLMVISLSCGRLELHHGRADSAIQVVDSVEQDGYTVHLLWDIGPPVGSTLLWVEQEKLIVPGLQFVRIVDTFDGENPSGKLTSEGMSTIRLRIPPTTYCPEEINRVYRLKRWVYF